ncbi:hypothetical protein CL616_03390 [archaeon]|nr:hypothetical protein [archaeon]
MLSPFLKKLLFVRQFLIDNGKIEILGQNQIMLPSGLLAEMQSIDKDKFYSVVKKHIQTSMQTYAKKMGTTSSGIIKSSQDIFETYGLGQFKLIKLDNTKKTAIVSISQSSLYSPKNKEEILLEAALDGMFSFLFKTNIKVESKANGKQSKQFIINKR